MIAIYDNYLEDNKDLIDAVSNISEGKKPKLGPDEVLVIKGKKEEAIDIDDLRDYLKKGWELHEATLTKNQQDMVKDVVDNDLDLEEFEKKYGKKDGKSVAFAVATKMVKKKEGITEDDLDEVKTPKYGTTNLSKRSGGATVSAREVPGYGMEAYTFSNKTQADKHAKKVGGETYHLGRVFYVRMKESVESDEALDGMKEDAISESYFKVTIPELPPFFLDARSQSEIKSQLRDMMKPEAYKNLSIERATKSEMQKLYRQLAKEPQPDKSVEEAVEVDGQNKLKEKNDTKKVHIMGDSHWEATDELVQYLRNLTPGESEKTKLDEATLPDTKDIEKGIDVPWVEVEESTSVGSASITVRLSLDAKKDWKNNIFQNSRHAIIHITPDGKMEMLTRGSGLQNMRKTTFKTSKDVVQKINIWIKKVR